MIPVYIGTYTRRESFVDGRGQGIYIYAFDPDSGKLAYRSHVAGLVNPSFICLSNNGGYLYAVNEITADFGDSGYVSAFSIDALTADLNYINQQSTHGHAPCHLSASGSDRFVMVANYASGSVCVLPVRDDGSLGEATDVVGHVGSGPISQRQSGPHAHMIAESPDRRYVLAADLGTDEVLSYRLDQERGVLLPSDPPAVKLSPGTGPRQFRFHPNGRFVYVIGELNSQIAVFHYAADTGSFEEIQNISLLPDGFTGWSSGAQIQVHPSGKFVYASNRGHDSIVFYAVDAESGELSLLGHQPCGGLCPRHFTLDPTGTFLLVANQNSDSIVTFRLNLETGELSPEQQVEVPTPVCIKFHPDLQVDGT
jgi:6-phosphogluconolactonase